MLKADFANILKTAIGALNTNKATIGPWLLQYLGLILQNLNNPVVAKAIDLAFTDSAPKVIQAIQGVYDTEDSLINQGVGDNVVSILTKILDHRLVLDALALLA